MSCKNYVSCTTLDNWFDDFNPDDIDWMIQATIEDLKDAVTENGMLMLDARDDEVSSFRKVNNAMLYAMRQLNAICKDVKHAIENGEIFVQKGKKGGKDEDDED